jgi:hypothetical protein
MTLEQAEKLLVQTVLEKLTDLRPLLNLAHEEHWRSIAALEAVIKAADKVTFRLGPSGIVR